MKISSVEVYVVKIEHHDRFGGQTKAPTTLAHSQYYFEDEWHEVYAAQTQTTLVRVLTDEGLYGWGECQAPIAPEVTAQLISELLGPMLIGLDPRSTDIAWNRMFTSMSARGQTTGFMLDAMSGVDIALWDIKGKAAGEPVARLLGGPHIRELPAYVSGIRAGSTEERAALAQAYFEEGYAGVKLYLGRGVERDIDEATALRDALPHVRFFSDLFWLYELPDALRLGRALESLGVEWLESPLDPEDIAGHAQLSRALDVAIAVGEPLRTARQFQPWFDANALDIAQPDVARCGISGARRIAEQAAVHNKPVAYHLGVCLGIGMVATWHLAAATSNMKIQEHEPPMLDLSNRFLTPGLEVNNGLLLVPEAPGLGVDIDPQALAGFIASSLIID